MGGLSFCIPFALPILKLSILKYSYLGEKMKSIAKIFALVLALLAASSVYAQDAYNDEASPQETEKDTYVENENPGKKAQGKKKPKQKEFGSSGNVFKDFIFGKEKYIYYDTVELATGTMAMGIKPRPGQMIFNPKTEMAGVQVNYQSAIFNILFDEKTRYQIADALSRYLEDYEGKRLVRKKNSKTRKIYGTGKCYVEWGTIKSMMYNYANTRVQFGYEFKGDSPYFCLIIKGAKNEQKNMGDYIAKESTEVQLYFTRTKARAFAAALSDDAIEAQREVYLQIMGEDSEEYSEEE